jgi:hypothetical protein
LEFVGYVDEIMPCVIGVDEGFVMLKAAGKKHHILNYFKELSLCRVPLAGDYGF